MKVSFILQSAVQLAVISFSDSATLPQRADQDQSGSWTLALQSWAISQKCTWLGVCKGSPCIELKPTKKEHGKYQHKAIVDKPASDLKGIRGPDDLKNESRVLKDIPDYVFEYAPLVHLFSGEKFWPCDMAEHLEHVTPYLNYTPIKAVTQNSNLTNLDKLNEFNDGRYIYLTSDDNVEERPDWLEGEKNIPEDDSEDLYIQYTPNQHSSHPRQQHPIYGMKPDELRGGRSDAPAVLVVVDKGHGIVDAFWFFFYSYNLGNIVFNIRFGNHVGDWEHSLVRFEHGVPTTVFVSEHFFGQAYTYDAVEKLGKRPVVYSATGTHAMYATPGSHPYILPLGLLQDTTDRGPLWDPALNLHSYHYNPHADSLSPSTSTPSSPLGWFFFNGHWGDRHYPLADDRQYMFAGQYHYVSGPLGPRFKHLGRKDVCQGPNGDACVIRERLPAEKSVQEVEEEYTEELRWQLEDEVWRRYDEERDWHGDERDPPGLRYDE